MKIVLKWILLVWVIIAIPYVLTDETGLTLFYALLFTGMLAGVLISDLKEHYNKKR